MEKVIDSSLSKIIVVMLLLSFCYCNLFSQKESKYFVEINLAKTTVAKSIFFGDETHSNLSYINGIRVGRLFNRNNSEIFLSILNETSVSELYFGGAYSTVRHQIGFGGNVELLGSKRLKFNLGSELLVNFNKYNGYSIIDAPFSFGSLNNLRTTEIGAAALFQLNYSLSPRFEIILNSRIGIYHRPKPDTDVITIDKSSYWVFEPVNMLGLRMNI